MSVQRGKVEKSYYESKNSGKCCDYVEFEKFFWQNPHQANCSGESQLFLWLFRLQSPYRMGWEFSQKCFIFKGELKSSEQNILTKNQSFVTSYLESQHQNVSVERISNYFQCIVGHLDIKRFYVSFHTNYLLNLSCILLLRPHTPKHLYFTVDIKILWSKISRDYVNNHVENVQYSTAQYTMAIRNCKCWNVLEHRMGTM